MTRKNAKQLPSILGSEPSVKISEKDFNHLMDMAQASGTLEKLNEIYDREMEYMQGAYSARTAHPFRRNGSPFRFKLSKAQLVD